MTWTCTTRATLAASWKDRWLDYSKQYFVNLLTLVPFQVRDMERGVEEHNPVHVLVEADPQDKPVGDAQYSSNRVQQQAAIFSEDRLLKTGSELRHTRPTAHARIAALPGRKCRPDQQSGG